MEALREGNGNPKFIEYELKKRKNLVYKKALIDIYQSWEIGIRSFRADME